MLLHHTLDFSTIPTINGTNVIKSGDNISLLTNNSGYLTSSSPGLWSGSAPKPQNPEEVN